MSVVAPELRIPAPELRGNNFALGACRDLEVCLDGPAGCVAGETRIYNPVTGEQTPIKELCEKGIAPVVQTLLGAIQAEVPFRKGVKRLYRVKLASGRQCVVTSNHLFLTPEGWRFASSCLPSQRLLVFGPCLHPSTEESALLVSPQDALRLSQTPLGSQEYYSVYSRPCDELPPSEGDIALTPAPLQDDVPLHNQDDFYRDDRAFSQGYIRRCQLCGHHARRYYSPLPDDRVCTLSRVQPGTFLRVDVLSQSSVRFPRKRSPLLPIAQSRFDDDNMSHRELLLSAPPAFSTNATHDDRGCRVVRQSTPHTLSSSMTQGSPAFVQGLDVCILSSPVSDAISSSFKCNYMAQWDTVSSIEYERTDEYFDLHVPLAEHYLAEGIWHHNSGKTVAALFKVHMLLLMYPGAKALVARKTNTALAGSAIATYREMIDPNEGVIYFGGNKIRPAAFEYPNGSVLVVNGLDKRDKIKSWEFDIAYINEATECDEEDIEYVRSRLRHGKLPYHQLIMDCNPDAPEHWLNLRMDSGKTTRLLSRHEDNPRYFDTKTNDWTLEGHEYIFVVLEGLTGVLLARMRYGLWQAAHGTVYQDVWDRVRNVVEPFSIPRTWARYLAIDWGYTNPFVCLWGAIDPDGRIYIYRQIYRTKRLVEDHAVDIALASGWYHLLDRTHPKWKDRPAEWADPLPRDIICDHDLEDRKTLERKLGLATIPAKKSITDGIQAMAARLRPAGDGKPRFMIFKNCLVELDQDLVKAKKPKCLEDEPPVYVWKKKPDLTEKEEPVDANNHGVDAGRYLCAYFDLMPNTVSYYKDIWR